MDLKQDYRATDSKLMELDWWIEVQGVSKKKQPFLSWISQRWFGQIVCPYRRLFSIAMQFYQA